MDVHKSGKRKFSEDQRQECTKSKKKKSKRRKKPSKYKKYSDSSETSPESDSSTSTSSLEDYKRKHKSSKRVSKHKKSKHESFNKSSKKKKHKRKHKEEKFRPIDKVVCKDAPKAAVNSDIGPIPETDKSMAPMTKEEWEKQQSVVRRVYDPETGRNRLVKGDGEILEEIVSRERHKEINKMATFNDGEYFRAKMGL